METNEQEKTKLKLFISYNHKDEGHIEEFKKHLAPLKQKGLIEEWYDRKIIPGENWEKEIENNLIYADIICLFISPNFLSSSYCQKEEEDAYNLKKRKNIAIVPIIISPCGWKDDNILSKSLALPTDGKPISTFSNRDAGWLDVYEGLKKSIENLIYSRNLTFKEDFVQFLQNADLLMKAHPKKENVYLKDIFVPPEFTVLDESKEYDKKIGFDDFMENILDYSNIVISGEALSGKTSICKIIFKKLRDTGLVPVYIRDQNRLRGRFEDIISRFFNQQYNGDIGKVDNAYIVPIIDDFHLAKNKDKVVSQILEKYAHIILTVDDIFSLNITDNELLSKFKYFSINELKPSQRYELIKKWVDFNSDGTRDVILYKEIDKKVEQIEDTLGKTFGRGVMPPFPFYILSAIITYETLSIPISQEITSQGYFYQAFIYLYLKKRGVKNDEIDIYVNFLTELSYYLFSKEKSELTVMEVNEFIRYYMTKFTLPIKKDEILGKIDWIFSSNNLNNYSFKYPYLYYFFVAKYHSENIEKPEIWEKIEHIMNNIHVEKNAYITVFLVHHSKNQKILNMIKSMASELFKEYKPVSLTKKETKFFDEHIEEIIEASLPPPDTTPEKERNKLLKNKDEIEEKYNDINEMLDINIRKAIKTGEVMGCILKSRVGSLEKNELVELMIADIDIHLRIVSSFFDMVKHDDAKDYIINLISKKLNEIIKEKNNEDMSRDEMRHLAENIFWNLSFILVFGLIEKAVHTVGSDKLIEIIELANKRINTPSYFLVKHGIYMWYLKNIDINKISKEIKRKDFSNLSKKVIKFMVIEYAYFHPINYRERQQITQYLKIPPHRIPRNLPSKRR